MSAVEAAGLRRVAGSPARIPEGTIPQLFFEAVERFDKPDVWKVRRHGAWHSLSHRRIADEVRRLALGLRDLGLRRGDRVAILSENRPEWHYADFACATSGLTSVPIYATLPADPIEYMLKDSEARAIFVSNAEQLDKVRRLRPTCPALEHAILFDGAGRADPFVVPLETVMAGGDAEIAAGRGAAYREEALAARPHDLLTILYTSGTTGRPKGVMLTHNNLVSNLRGVLQILPVGPDDTALSFLPLSHIFERLVAYAFFAAGITVAYCPSHEIVRDYLPEVRPTVMTAVPRVYEKVYLAVHDRVQAGSALRRKIFFWARSVAAEWTERKLSGRAVGPALAVQHRLADRLVYRKVRARTGGRIRFFISGGAPLDPRLGRFFYGFGLRIIEGYGLTETSPVICVNPPGRLKFGTVGLPIPGVEVAIAADGEILTRGPHIMSAYYKMPEETAAVIDADGWFHTGDIGELDEDG
ncbi:MAG: AMP-dependent synthetase/ligase, partial [Gemmatimonadota bacterium]